MLWLRLAISAVLVIAGGILTARAGDAIARRTGLGGLLFGTVLLSASTSLPDIFAGITAVRLNVPDLAAGDFLGGCLADMLVLGLLDLFSRQTRLLHRVAVTHSLTATLAMLLLGTATFFVLVPLGWRWGSLDLEGIVVLIVYLAGTRLIQTQARKAPPTPSPEPRRDWFSTLPRALAGFALAIVLLLVAVPMLVESAQVLALRSGLGPGFIGVAVFPLITTMPELTSSITAVRLGAYDLAVGNLFGSCIFNVAALAFVGLFYPHGPVFSAVSPGFAVVGALALMLIAMALLGNLARLEWRVLHVEWDALLIILIYLGGIFLLWRQGILLVAR